MRRLLVPAVIAIASIAGFTLLSGVSSAVPSGFDGIALPGENPEQAAHGEPSGDAGEVLCEQGLPVVGKECARWVRQYDGPSSEPILGELDPEDRRRVEDIQVGPEGKIVYVTGNDGGVDALNRYPDFVTIAYRADTGQEVWKSRYHPSHSPLSPDEANALAVGPSGEKIFVTGWTGAPRDFATVAYDAQTGQEEWISFYDGPDDGDAASDQDTPRDIEVSPDGSRVFVTGDDSTAAVTIAYDADTGQQEWIDREEGKAVDLAVHPVRDELYVTGWSGGSPDYLTIAYDFLTGDQVWSASYDGSGNFDLARSIAVTPSGSDVIVTGSSEGPPCPGSCPPSDITTVSYQADNGAQQWVSRYDGPASRHDFGRSIEPGPDGDKVYVTGESANEPFLGDDMVVLAYDATTGQEVWSDRYDGGTTGTDLVVRPGGSDLFVSVGGNSQFTAVAYATDDGTREWDAKTGGSGVGGGTARAIDVSPDGSGVFLGGEVYAPRSGHDLFTASFDAEGPSFLD